jgi:hypothetical protein
MTLGYWVGFGFLRFTLCVFAAAKHLNAFGQP